MYAKYKERDKGRKMESRKKVLSPRKAAMERWKCRDRVRLYRLKKKLAAPKATSGKDGEVAFKSPQALGKAVHKVSPLLPNSPRKRKQFSRSLQNQVDFPYQVNPSNQMAIGALTSPPKIVCRNSTSVIIFLIKLRDAGTLWLLTKMERSLNSKRGT